MRRLIIASLIMGITATATQAQPPGAVLMDLSTCTGFYTVLEEWLGEDTSRAASLDKTIAMTRAKAKALALRLGIPFETWEQITANTTNALRPPGVWTMDELVARYSGLCAEVLYR